MKLYCHPYAIIPWRIRIALREKGIPCEEVTMDVYSSPKRDPAFARLNPFGQIPVLQDGDLVVAESMAILEYLEELHPVPALMPRDTAKRATIRQLMCWSTDYWPPAWQKWMAPRLQNVVWTDATVQEGRKAIGAHLDVLQTRLAAQDWLVDSYSLADVCYAPLVLVLDRVGLGSELTDRPAVARWVERLHDRPAIQATMMPPAHA